MNRLFYTISTFLMDYKKYDLLLFKIEGISYSAKFTHNFFGMTSFSVCSSTSCRS